MISDYLISESKGYVRYQIASMPPEVFAQFSEDMFVVDIEYWSDNDIIYTIRL